MSQENLPGYEEAYKLGYSLYSHSGNKLSATYNKDRLSLTITTKGEATLSAMHKFVLLKVGPISFPHKNIHNFEKQIKDCLPIRTSDL